jgi:chemotaxis protein methyltransferase CheR
MRRSSQDQSSLFLLHGSRSSSPAGDDYVFETGVPGAQQRPRRALVDLGFKGRCRGGERMADALSRAVTGPESMFFAEQQTLEALVSHVMPALLATRRAARTLRIWSVGCGTGQPTYSLAIALHERCPELSRWNVEIVASDTSGDLLARARCGIYSDYEVQRGMSLERLERSFEQLPAGPGWRCRSPLSELISWLQLDPLESCSAVGVADLILCHQHADAGNFDPPARWRRLGRLIDQLASDGYLVLAAPEPAIDRLSTFESLPIEAAMIYRRVPRETSLLSA